MSEAPWGEQYYERERFLVPSVWRDSYDDSLTPRQEFKLHSDQALADPAYDAFEGMMPTGRPKRDIGRYVMQHGIPVPLIRSFAEWQTALMQGDGMLRSELPQDYAGYSGLLSTITIPIKNTYPLDEQGEEGYERDWTSRQDYIDRQTIEGPVRAAIRLRHLGGRAVDAAFHDYFADGLYDGTVDPAIVMDHVRWRDEILDHYRSALHYRYRPAVIEGATASHWRFVPGVNIRMMRDPVIEGKYFIGGEEAHHHWEISDGADSVDLEAYSKAVYRGRPQADESPAYRLPAGRLVKLYERIRTLPYFDQHQAPLMEMQYGKDGKVYFLQYLKTGLKLGDPGAFELPTGRDVVTVDDVRGATQPAGETVRIYIEPGQLTETMRGQAAYIGLDTGGHGFIEQAVAVTTSITVLDKSLNFKDNHFSNAPLVRSDVAIGLWDGRGEGEERFNAVANSADRTEWRDATQVDYIDAHITSNGRQAAIASDWILKHELLN